VRWSPSFRSPFLMAVEDAFLCKDSHPTVCVSRWWAGWDSVGEQKKPET